MRLVILGAPGVGKGTQAGLISNELKIVHISTGDMFRENIKSGTELGKLAQKYIDKGQLVPDDITINLVEDRLKEEDCKRGFILDGFPRTVTQAEALEVILLKMNKSLDKVLNIVVPDDIIVERMKGRKVCLQCGATYHLIHKPPVTPERCDMCGGTLVQRKDDTEETIRERLAIYHKETEPLIKYYKNKRLLVSVDGIGKPEEIAAKILRILEE